MHPRPTLLLLILVAALAGCTARSPMSAGRTAELAQLTYPGADDFNGPADTPEDAAGPAPIGEDLTVRVVRDGDALRVTNFEPRRLADMQLWLNQQYVSTVRGLDPGPTRLPLRQFINQHGEHFPLGGLLTPERNFPVVLAELYDPRTGQRHPLILQRDATQAPR
jgi:hypothetical protein